MPSPYKGVPPANWKNKTEELIAAHPLTGREIVSAVLSSWDSIFESRIGKHGIQIGVEVFPSPQVMGAFLHELIPLEIAARHKGEWCRDRDSEDKDLVYLPDPRYSVEIKTSSHKNQVFANRSYAQAATSSKKSKNGYYLTVNFQGFRECEEKRPRIRQIAFGWLEHTDWIAQRAQTGQQARLNPSTYKDKLIVLYADSCK